MIALLVNSIVIPILTNLFLEKDLYTQNGLIADVFTLSITNSFLSPLLKIFNPYYYYTLILKNRKSRPEAKIGLNQQQLNEYFIKMEFEVGYEYVYVINIYLFTCFFVPLQPIIPLFAVLGLTAMYWAQKYSLFHRCRRPVPGNETINTIMFQFIYIGPLVYSTGNLIWLQIFPDVLSSPIYTPMLLSFIFSVVILFLPYS